MVQLLLHHDTSPTLRDWRYGRCAQVACESNFPDILQRFLDKGVPLEASGEYRHELLVKTAIEHRSYACLELLLSTNPRLEREYPPWSAFQDAIWLNDLRSFTTLLEHATARGLMDKPRLEPRGEKTPRRLADGVLELAATGAYSGFTVHPEFVALALKAGGNPNDSSTHWTPFIGACEHAEPSAVRLMLDAGADVNKRCPSRTPSPVAAAVESKSEEPFFDLVQRGADITLDDGLIHEAARRGHAKVAAYLLDHNASRAPHKDDRRATDLLSEAIKSHYPAVVRTLLEHGFRPGAIDNSRGDLAATHEDLARRFAKAPWQLREQEVLKLIEDSAKN